MRALALALAGLAAALAAGCGGSPGGASTTAARSAEVAVTIATPADGKVLKATRTAKGRWRARTRVSGRARPGSAVALSATCRPTPCAARARAAADGRWAATLTLTATPAARFVTIDAGPPRAAGAPGSAVATVELSGPAAPAPKRAKAGAKRPRPAASAGRAPRRLPHDVLVVGDSLALGIAETLPAALPGWRVRTDGRIGRPLAEGMGIFAGQASPPAIVAFSLFTNDDPRNTAALEAAVRATASRPGGCAVWATIVRPPFEGVSYDAANALLHRLAGDPELALGLQLVDWAAEVAQSPALIAADGVHGSPDGYRALGRLYAEAIRRCAGDSG